MAVSYQHPGVYIEEVPSGSKPIEAVGTSTAVFLGYCLRGPVKEPVLITSWSEYESLFGGIQDRGDEASLQVNGKLIGDPMGHSVFAFFQNGGGKAYIVRMVDGATKASGKVTDSGTDLLLITAANEGAWGKDLTVVLEVLADADDNNLFRVTVGTGSGSAFEALEVFDEVDLRQDQPNYLTDIINGRSSLVRMEIPSGVVDTLRTFLNSAADDTIVTLSEGGGNGSEASTDEYTNMFTRLRKYRDIDILLLPGSYWKTGAHKDRVTTAIAHADSMRNCMVIIDPEPGVELSDAAGVAAQGFSTSQYAALYYPWVVVGNPFYDPERNPGKARIVLVAPSAFAAGMWARIDGRRGVWKAPAGVEATLLGVSDLEFTVENDEQDFLNPAGVNAFRRLAGYGSVVWGARTLATRADPEWRYVPVRRTALFLEESLYQGIQWAVFEPNDHRLWSALRLNIESFMNGLFRVGAFQGEKASDAYFVRCGLGSTMTQGDIDAGRVVIEVGFAPLKPAEFVVVRIQQKVGQQ